MTWNDSHEELYRNITNNGVQKVIEQENYGEEGLKYTRRFLESVSPVSEGVEGRFDSEAVLYDLKNDRPVQVTYGNGSVSFFGDEETVDRAESILTAEAPIAAYLRNIAGVEAEAAGKALKNFGGLFEGEDE